MVRRFQAWDWGYGKFVGPNYVLLRLKHASSLLSLLHDTKQIRITLMGPQFRQTRTSNRTKQVTGGQKQKNNAKAFKY